MHEKPSNEDFLKVVKGEPKSEPTTPLKLVEEQHVRLQKYRIKLKLPESVIAFLNQVEARLGTNMSAFHTHAYLAGLRQVLQNQMAKVPEFKDAVPILESPLDNVLNIHNILKRAPKEVMPDERGTESQRPDSPTEVKE